MSKTVFTCAFCGNTLGRMLSGAWKAYRSRRRGGKEHNFCSQICVKSWEDEHAVMGDASLLKHPILKLIKGGKT